MEILRIDRQNESLTRRFSHPQCGHAFLPVHLASNTGGTWLTTFSIAKSRKPINNLSTGRSLLFFGRKTKAALVGIPALLGMPIFLSRRYAPVFEVEPIFSVIAATSPGSSNYTIRPLMSATHCRDCSCSLHYYRNCFTRFHLCQIFTMNLLESCQLFANQIRASLPIILLRCRRQCHNE